MTAAYDALYLSPHLDDVALSCGGHVWQRARRGERVLVVTVAAGEPPPGAPLSDFARALHTLWGLDDGVAAVRRREDEAAFALLGADVVHWLFPDCVYRADPADGRPFYPSVEAIFGAVDPADMPLVARLADEMRGLPAAGVIICPLGVGNHVDHQLTRAAAQEAFGRSLVFYEDFPYAGRGPWAVDGQLRQHAAWQLEIVALDEEAIARRCDAVATYVSQVPSLFGDETAARQAIREYVTAVGGERLWRLAT